MTRKERRGKWLFLVMATLIILDKLIGVALSLSGGLTEIRWLKSVAQPIVVVLMVAFLWQGDPILRWLVGLTCVSSGGQLVFISGRLLVKLAEVTPPEATGFFFQVAGYPVGFVGLFGLLYVVAGLLFLFSPSIRAFFRYQREPRPVWIETV